MQERRTEGGWRAAVWLAAVAGLARAALAVAEPCEGRPSPPFKREPFMSRGWGAAGLPYHPEGRTLGELLSAAGSLDGSLKGEVQQAAQARFLHHTPSATRLQEPQMEYLTAAQQEQMKQNYIPQLFVSYGWGPHGRK